MPQPCVSDATPAASWWLPSLFDANKIKSMPGNHVLCWLPTFAFMQLNLTRERAPVCSSKAEGICPRICNRKAKQNSGLYVFKSGDAPKNTKQIANLSVNQSVGGRQTECAYASAIYTGWNNIWPYAFECGARLNNKQSNDKPFL